MPVRAPPWLPSEHRQRLKRAEGDLRRVGSMIEGARAACPPPGTELTFFDPSGPTNEASHYIPGIQDLRPRDADQCPCPFAGWSDTEGAGYSTLSPPLASTQAFSLSPHV